MLEEHVEGPHMSESTSELPRSRAIPVRDLAARHRQRSKRVSDLLKSLSTNLVLAIVAFLYFVPMLYLVSTAIKAPGESYVNPGLIPHSIDLAKFPEVWRRVNILQLTANSTIITVSTVLLVLFLGSLAGYAFSRLRFFAKSFYLLLFLAGLMIPFAGVIVPLFQMNKVLGTKDTYLGVIGPYVAYGLPFAILFLRSYFDTLPRAIEESALIDGASRLVIFWRVLLPLTKPALATVAIFQALSAWNEFLIAMLVLTKDHLRTLPLGSLLFQSQYTNEFENMFALLLMIAIPPIALFVAMQRQFIAGLTSGAVKGG
jgi:ABC-type glycerol-3-phosphate transport system permease component